ncbi:MAG TPA: ISKra4 family transposase, partial [Streptosporangiaceae bacterium]|nr:ISKra4 family transposase [Streptosporangiaceae bacterium]
MAEYVREPDGEEFAGSGEEFGEIKEWLGGAHAAELDHAGLEEQIALRIREVQRLLLQEHLDLRAAREQRRDDVTGPDGLARTRAEHGHSRLLATTLGQVRVTRIAYRAPGAPNVHPADAQLNLPPEKHSHGLCRQVATGAARSSIGPACAAVSQATGVRIGTRQAQQIIRAAAADFDAFYAGREHPPGAAPGDVLALSCDAKGIVMRPGQLRPEAARKAARAVPKQDGRLSRGEVATRKR